MLLSELLKYGERKSFRETLIKDIFFFPVDIAFYGQLTYDEDPAKTDFEAIASDWTIVGKDMQKAFERFEHEKKK